MSVLIAEMFASLERELELARGSLSRTCAKARLSGPTSHRVARIMRKKFVGYWKLVQVRTAGTAKPSSLLQSLEQMVYTRCILPILNKLES